MSGWCEMIVDGLIAGTNIGRDGVKAISESPHSLHHLDLSSMRAFVTTLSRFFAFRIRNSQGINLDIISTEILVSGVFFSNLISLTMNSTFVILKVWFLIALGCGIESKRASLIAEMLPSSKMKVLDLSSMFDCFCGLISDIPWQWLQIMRLNPTERKRLQRVYQIPTFALLCWAVRHTLECLNHPHREYWLADTNMGPEGKRDFAQTLSSSQIRKLKMCSTIEKKLKAEQSMLNTIDVGPEETASVCKNLPLTIRKIDFSRTLL